ncbi:MAG TPA: DNA mismatch repair endonuclease MutL [Pseudogracilibacillus sp.]|nr:DNA mismatch repair endonuclease MutL [Pseudogracilibacillus sp.]
MNIRQLPEALANKIAAGEVVERPQSVVKELIENSIDADSTSIFITLKEAGLTEIKVTDNGTGMTVEDAEHAFLRHATSKIHYDQDLFHIKSLGFRGEALASIAAVSKLTLTTSQGEEAGTKIYSEAGELLEIGKSDARKGTEITVQELFYNTPARLKYMKSIHTELGHITDIVNRYALAHPSIRFEVMHNDKRVFQSPGTGNRLQVIRQIYGLEVAKNMFQMKDSSLDFSIEGFIAKPTTTRANRNYITFLVNGRYVKSNALTHAIVRAYDTLLPIHRYPVAVIAIKLDPILVDVNVHPTKLEVRFSKEKALIDMLESMIRSTLRSTSLIPKMEHQPKQRTATEQATMDFNPSPQTPAEREPDIDIPAVDSSFEDGEDMKESSRFTLDSEQIQEQGDISPIPEPVQDESPLQETYAVPPMYPIGQLQGTYILAQNEKGFFMVDQHAAQERIKYEFFKEKLGKTADVSQQLLMPLTFEFTTNEILFIEKHREQLETVGLVLEPFGGQTYAVKSHPSWFPAGEEQEIIRDMVDQIIQTGSVDIEKLREEVAILMSCKRSIKANHYLKMEDMSALLDTLRETQDPFTCPHGRPVIIHFTYYEIEKMFKRIM